MTWQGAADSDRIGVGAQIHIVELSATVGIAPRQLPNNTDLPIEMTDGAWLTAKVVSSTDGEAELVLSDDTLWRMTHQLADDLSIGINSPGLHAVNWIVRSQLDA